MRPQNLRKWFANQGNKTSLSYIGTRHLLGHLIKNSTSRAYIKPDYGHLYKLYYKNMDAFTLFDKVEVHDFTDEKVRKLEQEREEDKKEREWMRREIEHLKRHAKDREELD